MQIILPKIAYQPLLNAIEDDRVDEEVSESFAVLDGDETISGLGIARELDDSEPYINFERKCFGVLSTRKMEEEGGEKFSDEDEEVQILKAVFERGRRKWQFIRKGIKISAPILDMSFYDRLSSRNIILGDGDTLAVMLRTHQVWNDLINVWVDDKYEIVKVYEHHKNLRQTTIDEY